MAYSFWDIVKKVKDKAGNNWEDRPEFLNEVLMKRTPEEIIQFKKDYDEKLLESYQWNLWGAAYLINGGCSDDSFDYFRDFLISEGQEVFESALSNPESLVELNNIEDMELEEYQYAIDEAYEELTDDDIPELDIDWPSEPKGTAWSEENLEAMFPRLAKKYA